MSNTEKYILAGVIFLIIVVTIILVYLNLRHRRKKDKDHGHDKHTEIPCPTECAKKNDHEKDETDEEDCKCGV